MVSTIQRPLFNLSHELNNLKNLNKDLKFLKERLSNAKNNNHKLKLKNEINIIKIKINNIETFKKTTLKKLIHPGTVLNTALKQQTQPGVQKLPNLTPEQASEIQRQIREKYPPTESVKIEFPVSTDELSIDIFPVASSSTPLKPRPNETDHPDETSTFSGLSQYLPSKETMITTAKIVVGVAIVAGIGYLAYRYFCIPSSETNTTETNTTDANSRTPHERAIGKAKDMVAGWHSHLSSTKDSLSLKKATIIDCLKKGSSLSDLLNNKTISKREWYYILANNKLADWGFTYDKIGNPPDKVLKGVPA